MALLKAEMDNQDEVPTYIHFLSLENCYFFFCWKSIRGEWDGIFLGIWTDTYTISKSSNWSEITLLRNNLRVNCPNELFALVIEFDHIGYHPKWKFENWLSCLVNGKKKIHYPRSDTHYTQNEFWAKNTFWQYNFFRQNFFSSIFFCDIFSSGNIYFFGDSWNIFKMVPGTYL